MPWDGPSLRCTEMQRLSICLDVIHKLSLPLIRTQLHTDLKLFSKISWVKFFNVRLFNSVTKNALAYDVIITAKLWVTL